uniref:Mitochondrial fission 1 protein n=1 Tax=Trichuris muris TaxID=70415 RepID=A0A5S6QVP0_TRIMR
MNVLDILNKYGSIAAFVDHNVDRDDLKKKRMRFDTDQENAVHPYAVALIFGSASDTKLGLDLLQDELADRTKQLDNAEFLLLMAVGNLRLKEHVNALDFANALNELHNARYDGVSRELLKLINERIVAEGMKNFAIIATVGGILMGALYAISSYFFRKNRRRSEE